MSIRSAAPCLPPILLLLLLCVVPVQAQQIDIPRIEQMPALPQPYEMRDWAQVAAGYDTLVFNFNATGQYMPFVWWNPNPVNYPGHPSFGLDTVVGTPFDYHTEAINAIPAVISASLVGIDKSDQDGHNFVLMCEEYFNHRPEENIYLNGFIAQSGSDWWYETMPNIFFYQLRDLYPGTGDFDNQFTTVADQFLACVQSLGGSTTPWTAPNMNYRAFSFSTMTPLNEGVREPEAAGAIAWLLYMAYNETRDAQYRIAAEQAMEFLNARTSNPSYELQLAYGTLAAARMNGELGTTYDLEQLVNWCFDVGPLRNWGSIVGNWGGFDVDGLIGEVSGNDYAFMMNGFQQAGALVPMVRYDDRYARAIGKWVLNLANASRLFYPYSLDGDHQDSEWWSEAHDPGSLIGHEAMREEWNGFSPFATGDAASGGWGATNLMLYSSSHVGYLGGILETTNIEGILLLDLLKTDWYHNDAYPSYLLYNPYDIMQTVAFDVGETAVDVYDCVSNTMIATGVSGTWQMQIVEDSARLPVLIPSGAAITHDNHGRMLANGIVVDFITDQGGNRAPRIKSLNGDPNPGLIGEPVTLYCAAEDYEGGDLSYTWSADAGSFEGEGGTIIWNAPTEADEYEITVEVNDGNGGVSEQTLVVSVLDNRPPEIIAIGANPSSVSPGGEVTLTCTASDPDEDDLTYAWSAQSGTFEGEGATVLWTAPDVSGDVLITCTVSDPDGAFDTRTRTVTVGSNIGLWYLDGNANDASEFGNHGTLHGPVPGTDRGGNPGFCLMFDGEDDHVRIPASPSLNVTNAIAINLWFNVLEHPDREAFIISHGSWQNRWKISILPDHRIRWTIKTEDGTYDMDTGTQVLENRWINLTAMYSNGQMSLLIGSELVFSREASGDLLTSDIDLTIGQMLPGDNGYNFIGRIDDVRIYNRMLSLVEIAELASLVSVDEDVAGLIPEHFTLHPAYPNPFNATARIAFDLPETAEVALTVFNLEGRHVATLVQGSRSAGSHTVHWDAGNLGSGVYFLRIKAGTHSAVRKVVLVK